MKKVMFILICLVGLSTTAFAQAGDFVLGAKVLNGSQFNQMGLGVNVQCFVSDNVRVSPSFDIFFRKAGVTTWDVNVDAHYVFNVVDKFSIYPIAGIGYSHWSSNYDGISNLYGSSSRFAANLGAGAEYYFTDKIGLVGEFKYQFMADYSQTVFSLGINYKF